MKSCSRTLTPSVDWRSLMSSQVFEPPCLRRMRFNSTLRCAHRRFDPAGCAAGPARSPAIGLSDASRMLRILSGTSMYVPRLVVRAGGRRGHAVRSVPPPMIYCPYRRPARRARHDRLGGAARGRRRAWRGRTRARPETGAPACSRGTPWARCAARSPSCLLAALFRPTSVHRGSRASRGTP